MTCRTGCRTQDHASWGECARASALQIGALQGANAVSRRTDKRLAAYASAKAQGIQPQGTQLWQSQLAVEKANRTGVADA